MLIRDQLPEKLDTPRNSIYRFISKFPSTKNKNKVTFKIYIQEGFTSLSSCLVKINDTQKSESNNIYFNFI